MAALEGIPAVDIDAEGVYKYVLIAVSDDSGNRKLIVRGYRGCEYHDDVAQRAMPAIEALGLETEVQGGGRIKHVAGREIFVYGYSMAFGLADHAASVKLLEEAYPSYEKITFSNEGY